MKQKIQKLHLCILLIIAIIICNTALTQDTFAISDSMPNNATYFTDSHPYFSSSELHDIGIHIVTYSKHFSLTNAELQTIYENLYFDNLSGIVFLEFQYLLPNSGLFSSIIEVLTENECAIIILSSFDEDVFNVDLSGDNIFFYQTLPDYISVYTSLIVNDIIDNRDGLFASHILVDSRLVDFPTAQYDCFDTIYANSWFLQCFYRSVQAYYQFDLTEQDLIEAVDGLLHHILLYTRTSSSIHTVTFVNSYTHYTSSYTVSDFLAYYTEFPLYAISLFPLMDDFYNFLYFCQEILDSEMFPIYTISEDPIVLTGTGLGIGVFEYEYDWESEKEELLTEISNFLSSFFS